MAPVEKYRLLANGERQGADGDETYHVAVSGGRSTRWTVAKKYAGYIVTAVVALGVGFSVGIIIAADTKAARASEYQPAVHATSLETIRFDGTAGFKDNGEIYRIYDHSQPQYVGEPSPEIDANWNYIVHGTRRRYFWISPEEAKHAFGSRHLEFAHEGRYYHVELSFMHVLHCVNMLRKMFRPDYYPNNHTEEYRKYHIDHCLDAIRQQVQCDGDMTLVPARYWVGAGRDFSDSNQIHTCRDWKLARDWVTERFNGSLKVIDNIPPAMRDKEETGI